jgi:hypothetical protein
VTSRPSSLERCWPSLTLSAIIPAMDPGEPAADPTPRSLAHDSQTTCYLTWLKVSVALRYVRTFPWAPGAWREVRQHSPWLLAEPDRLRKAGCFN